MRTRMLVDIGMTVLLMLLMASELIGRAAHEWIGMAMFVLFIIHHIFNRKWMNNLFHGKYTAYRLLQTMSAVFVFAAMPGSMISAPLISREVLSVLPISEGQNFGRTLHMLSAYWGFLFLSFHLRVHWNMIVVMAGRLFKKKSVMRTVLVRMIVVLVAAYGIYALFYRTIRDYLFLQTQFVFFDYEESIVFFFLDYLAIMELFAFIGHYTGKAVRKLKG